VATFTLGFILLLGAAFALGFILIPGVAQHTWFYFVTWCDREHLLSFWKLLDFHLIPFQKAFIILASAAAFDVVSSVSGSS